MGQLYLEGAGSVYSRDLLQLLDCLSGLLSIRFTMFDHLSSAQGTVAMFGEEGVLWI